MWQVARRPQWIAALLLALGIAVAFAALGHWQLSRAVIDATVVVRATETVKPLEEVVTPQTPVLADEAGQMVSFDGTLVQGDSTILSGRLNGGVAGYWVMGHVVADNGASVAVALGWAATEEEAEDAAAPAMAITALTPWVGRYLATESPQETDFENGVQNAASVAALVNEWSTAPDGVYGGYVVSAEAPSGLTAIDSPAPDDEVSLNWLNVFYAVEWVVFSGVAVFLWFRLVRDAWEREQEEDALDAEDAALAAELAELN